MSWWYRLTLIVSSLFCCCAIDNDSDKNNNVLDNRQFRDYVNLASDIQDFFYASSVFIVNAGQYENPTDLLLMSEITKEFSRKFVLSQTINFTKFHQEVVYYDGKTVQPFFVIMLRTIDDLEHFSATTKYYNMALHKWLVIFDKSKDKKFNDYCLKPKVNLLNLVVSTKMLVKCWSSPMLKEWYSIDRSRVEALDYGTYSCNQGILRLNDVTFYKRRSNFKGHKVKVATIKNGTPMTKKSKKFRANDFFGTVLIELSKRMNFTIEHVTAKPTYGIWNVTRNEWTGVIGELVAKNVDVGVGEFTMNQQRANVVDYTVPLMLTFSDLYIRRPNMTIIDRSSYTKAFQKDIWLILAFALMIVPLMFARLKGTEIGYDYLVEEYTYIWGIYCQKSLPDFPSASSLRVAYVTIFVSSLVVYSFYSAYLTSYLTIFTFTVPFVSYREFVADGTYKLIVLRDSVNHEIFLRKQKSIFYEMGKFMKKNQDLPLDIHSAINQVCNEKVALFTNQLFIEKISRYSPCEVMALTAGRMDNLGFTLVKDSPYTDIFNYNLKSMRSYGIIERFKRRYFKKFEFKNSNYLPITFLGILPIVGVFLLGVALSIVILICECGIYRQRHEETDLIVFKKITTTRSML